MDIDLVKDEKGAFAGAKTIANRLLAVDQNQPPQVF